MRKIITIRVVSKKDNSKVRLVSFPLNKLECESDKDFEQYMLDLIDRENEKEVNTFVPSFSNKYYKLELDNIR